MNHHPHCKQYAKRAEDCNCTDEAVNARRLEAIRRSLNDAHDAGEIPYCMDDEQDRERMAEWILKNVPRV